jgi:DNA-binding response OmpR family regulator
VILLDCQLPGISGFEVTKIIREFEKNKKKTIIVAMTADAFAGNKEKCLEEGMDDFIPKPIDPDVLFDTLSKYVSLNRFMPSKPTKKKELKENIVKKDEKTVAQESNTIFNYQKMLDRYGNDLEIVKTILKEFITETPDIIARIQNFSKTGNRDEIKFEAHSLKGSSSNIHAEQLEKKIIILETIAGSSSITDQRIHCAILAVEDSFEDLMKEINKIMYN